MFDAFKAKHGGSGPFEIAGNIATRGYLGYVKEGRQNRALLDSLVEQQRQDSELNGVMGDLWAGAQRKMTPKQLADYATALQQRATNVHQVNSAVDGFDVQQGKLRDETLSKFDRAQLDVLDTQARVAHQFLLSSNPATQQDGAKLLSDVFAAQRQYSKDNEQQNIQMETALGPQRWQAFSGLQDNYRTESLPFLQQRASFGRIKAALAEPSAAGDLALIFNYMKILDPQSVVREGEQAAAQNAAGVPDIVRTLYNNALRNGERLSPEQRRDIWKQSVAGYNQAQSEQVERNSRYLGQARDVGLPDAMLSHFVLPLESPGEVQPNFGQGPQEAPRVSATPSQRDAMPETTQPDTTGQMVGESLGQGLKTAAGAVGEVVQGLGRAFGIGGGRPAPARATDEYQPTPPQVSPDGTIRGVYVPPMLRRYFGR